MVGSTRKGKELAFEYTVSLTQNGVSFFVFASIVPLDEEQKE